MWSWAFTEMYSPLEVAIAIMIAALPMAKLSQIGLKLIQRKAGVDL